jgi:hypothetical protein
MWAKRTSEAPHFTVILMHARRDELMMNEVDIRTKFNGSKQILREYCEFYLKNAAT